jgi:hypothetical protein
LLVFAIRLIKATTRGKGESDTVADNNGPAEVIAALLIEQVADPPTAVVFAKDLLDLDASEAGWTDVQRLAISGYALERIRQYVREDRDMFAERADEDSAHVTWRWRDLLIVGAEQTTEIQNYLRRLVAKNSSNVVRVLFALSVLKGGTEPVLWGEVSRDDLLRKADVIYGSTELVSACERYREASGDDRSKDPHDLVGQFELIVANQ